jgi:hypothetical protein
MRTRAAIALLVCALTWLAHPPDAAAQTPAQTGRLLVTIVDTTGGVLPTASVTLTRTDVPAGATPAPMKPVVASDKGIATFENLPLGTYSVTAEFNGFQPNTLKDLKLKAGDNKHVLVLGLKAMSETVTVSEDRQTAASDRGVSFGSAMTREQIDALSDDPTEMQRQLQEMGGPDAIIRVDGFEGAPLPPKAQIKSIHITRDQFAAENHNAGATFIEIITQPGVGALRMGTNFGFSDGRLNGADPLLGIKPPSQSDNVGFNIAGTLVKDRSNYSLNVNGGHSYTTPTFQQIGPNGEKVSAISPIRTPRTNVSVSGLFDYAITRDQTLRINYNQFQTDSTNLGLSNFDRPERGYDSTSQNYGVRVQEAGPLGRRFFTNTRVALTAVNSSSNAALEAQTYRVNEAFTSGGAQVAGGTHTKNLLLQSDIDYVRGIHSFRGGIGINSNWYRSDANSNYLGTYTFTSNDAFEAQQPALFTQRVGSPLIKYFYLSSGLYVQDDIRVRKNLTISAGVRYEFQNHASDYNNFGPRVGVTWAPFKSGRTTLRASAGIFYEYISAGTVQQTLQFNGTGQQEISVSNPIFNQGGPPPGGLSAPSNIYEFAPGVQLQRSDRLSASWNQVVTKRISFNMSYQHVRAYNLLSGVNMNAPVNGVRPNPEFANIIATASDARSATDNLSTGLNISIAAPSPQLQKDFFNLRRGSVNVFYYLGRVNSDQLGAFTVSPTGTLATEWGPSFGDTRHRVSLGINSSAIRNFNASLSLGTSTGTPYTVTTGLDNNGDFFFNDRPDGIGRNTLRTTGQWQLSGFFSYNLGFGKRTTMTMPGGMMIMNGPGGAAVSAAAMSSSIPKYRVTIFVNAFNITNHANLTGFVGNISSPYFMQATTPAGSRQVSLNASFSF